MRIGLIQSMLLDRVNFRLTITSWVHPRGRGEDKVDVEQFDSEAALLKRYDELVALEERHQDECNMGPADD